jgi:hypothetical protein
MNEQERDGLEALRKFLRPTLRGKVRALALQMQRRLFPARF